jgi:hypothetical protein
MERRGRPRLRAVNIDLDLPLLVVIGDHVDDDEDSRAVHVLPSGMEKVEEEETHLQSVLIETGRTLKVKGDIPIPTIRIDEKIAAEMPSWDQPRHYLHFREDNRVDRTLLYDIDASDDTFLSSIDADRIKVTDDQFEKWIVYFEEHSSEGSLFCLSDIDQNNAIVAKVYQYWMKKRLQKGMPLLPKLKPPPDACRILPQRSLSLKMTDDIAKERLLDLKDHLLRIRDMSGLALHREKLKIRQVNNHNAVHTAVVSSPVAVGEAMLANLEAKSGQIRRLPAYMRPPKKTTVTLKSSSAASRGGGGGSGGSNGSHGNGETTGQKSRADLTGGGSRSSSSSLPAPPPPSNLPLPVISPLSIAASSTWWEYQHLLHPTTRMDRGTNVLPTVWKVVKRRRNHHYHHQYHPYASSSTPHSRHHQQHHYHARMPESEAQEQAFMVRPRMGRGGRLLLDRVPLEACSVEDDAWRNVVLSTPGTTATGLPSSPLPQFLPHTPTLQPTLPLRMPWSSLPPSYRELITPSASVLQEIERNTYATSWNSVPKYPFVPVTCVVPPASNVNE